MSAPKVYTTDHADTFKLKALNWASSFDLISYFDSNGYPDPYSVFDAFIGAGSEEKYAPGSDPFGALEDFLKHQDTFIPGYFGYDLKNQLENLVSENPDHLGFPDIHFVHPQHIILLKGIQVTIYSSVADEIWSQINSTSTERPSPVRPVEIKSRFTKQEYVAAVNGLKDHIKRGDIYEINFCQEFYADDVEIDPLATFIQLNKVSPTPFSGFLKLGNRFIISATPERFLSRRGDKLISQPIKGTSARSSDRDIDERQKKSLSEDEKERAENVMIVDLVRNDLTRSAKPGTVSVEELFGVYSFTQVHQLISTVVCECAPGLSNAQIIANTFPMGSMTGAPKIKAMILAEQFERSKRGVYSGAVGYFAPNGDFDFNVIIRTLLYNSSTKYVSFQTGGAITFDSDAEKEYDECVLKAKAILKVLNARLL